jgi:hypothetical protein
MRTIFSKLETITHWSHAMKVALAIVTMIVLLVCGLAVEYGLLIGSQKEQIATAKKDEDAAVRAAIAYSDSQWCGALTILTSTPVPKPADPAANPSREVNYKLYTAFTGVENKFRCK